ncbi:glycoside hydrolase family 130 protein [Evansella cellulosilytica]|uniref:Glycosidase related protein n=1 Tax=Evansella cellulosilytica (strain ATCC 21833 / DSM 2522 / FERM P-1141 / JCM 9156 / N-4) TaxID=649639 RepID=E6TTJ9_EVAC2|nr:glycoside hydrolase family 130 protein [Evansella cellulosilytica]ADU29635.1 glycosidase related protein [Evansella cellulosilytica DSM 2522]
MTAKIIGEKLAEIPWEDKPIGHEFPVWRHSENPIIKRNPVKGISRIFNSAVAPFEDKFVGVFRAETINGRPHLTIGWSEDAVQWDIQAESINFEDEDGKPFHPKYAYDPRLVKVEDTYYIIWCTDFYGAAIGLAETKDFKRFVRLENPFLPFNRNGVLFPRKVNGNYMMLSRPSDSGHTPFGDIFLSESPDLKYWGKHRHVMSKGGHGWWQNVKIGGGPAPIETTEGWLVFYHGVTGTCNGYVYSMGVAVLDIDQPSKVKYRSLNLVLTPEMDYETTGFVDNVIFPCATLHCAESGKIAIYYGSADTCVGMAYTTVEEIVQYAKDTHESVGDDQELGKI